VFRDQTHAPNGQTRAVSPKIFADRMQRLPHDSDSEVAGHRLGPLQERDLASLPRVPPRVRIEIAIGRGQHAHPRSTAAPLLRFEINAARAPCMEVAGHQNETLDASSLKL